MPEPDAIEILVVDDDPFMRLDMSDRLRRRGFSVLRAGNAAQAIRLMEGHPSVRAVLSDREMPDMDGLELLRLIARRWPGRRLVLVSGWSAPPGDEMPPGSEFLLKPVSRAQLDEVLTRL